MDNQSTTVTDEVTITLPDQIIREAQRYDGDRYVVTVPEEAFTTTVIDPVRDEDADVQEHTGYKPLLRMRIGFNRYRSYSATEQDNRLGALLDVTKRQFAQLVSSMFNKFMQYVRTGELTNYDAGPVVYRLHTGRWNDSSGASKVSAHYVSRGNYGLVVDGLRLEFNQQQWADMIAKATAVEVPMQAVPLDDEMIRYSVTYTISHTVELEPDELLGDLGEIVENEEGERFVVIPGTESEVNDLLYESVNESFDLDLPDNWADWDYYEQEESNVEDLPEPVEYDRDEHGRMEDDEEDETDA